jgi:demethylmenaquinone methyltransferase / 2-methoxy-6-polyprenyl-1,4-benzoquinol methylase
MNPPISSADGLGTAAGVPAGATPDVRAMFDRIAGRYDAANRAMSGGIDVLWRKRAMKPLLADLGEAPRILDLGAGTLDGVREIARRRPRAVVVGADFAREMLKVGRSKLGTKPNLVLTHAADGHRLPYAAGIFDAAFSAFCVRNLADLPVALGELRRVVRPGGTLVVLEFFRPSRPRFFFDKVWNARVLPVIGWAVTGDRDAYRYLPASIDRFLCRAEFEEKLRQAGFAHVQGEDLFPAGVASLVVAR